MKKYLSIFAVFMFSVFLCTNVNAASKKSYNKMYDAVISDYYKYVVNFSDKSSKDGKYKGIAEVAAISGELSLDDIGYTIGDITGDKIPELIFYKVMEPYGKNPKGKNALVVYSIVKGSPKLIFQNTDEKSYSNIGKGKFACAGNSGMYQTFGVFTLSKAGDKLDCDYFHFLKVSDGKIILFSNKIGEINEKFSKKQVISNEKFTKIWDKIFDRTKAVKVTPLKIYKKNSSSAKQKISVYYEEDAKSKYKNYIRFTLKSEKPEAKVFFVPNSEVKDFKLIGLTYKSINNNGKLKYDKKVLYSIETLTPQKPLLADLRLFGSIPNVGISFEDNSGKIRTFTVNQSGEDGSIYLLAEDF